MKIPARVRMTGPLAPYAQGFCQELATCGYKTSSQTEQLYLMAHLSRWLEQHRLDVHGVTPEHIAQFIHFPNYEFDQGLVSCWCPVMIGIPKSVGLPRLAVRARSRLTSLLVAACRLV